MLQFEAWKKTLVILVAALGIISVSYTHLTLPTRCLV